MPFINKSILGLRYLAGYMQRTGQGFAVAKQLMVDCPSNVLDCCRLKVCSWLICDEVGGFYNKFGCNVNGL
jgi:hypothetical protein